MLVFEDGEVGDQSPQQAPAALFFGRRMRQKYFSFAPTYVPLNHGSFGASPSPVREYQRYLQNQAEARPDTFLRFTYPELLRDARAAVAPLLGADTDEVVLVPNVTTGVNTVLRNLEYDSGDVILYFSTIYNTCLHAIKSIEETTSVSSYCIQLVYPVEDHTILAKFRDAVESIRNRPGVAKRVKLALFDTVLTFPGVRFPWESMIWLCKEYGILSCVDGAHGVGHIDLTHLPQIEPDFFVSNCYKWLMVPRGCAVLFVPRRNHGLIKTTCPTSEGFLPENKRKQVDVTEYFVRLFEKVATVDITPYVCLLRALQFRQQVCGGEERIREYCHQLSNQAGQLMAHMMGTEALGKGDCCFVNLRLPLSWHGSAEEAQKAADWITMRSVDEFDTFLATRYYQGGFWTRLSTQVYLELADFEWAATVLLELCKRLQEAGSRGDNLFGRTSEARAETGQVRQT